MMSLPTLMTRATSIFALSTVLVACGQAADGIKIAATKPRCYSIINTQAQPSRWSSSGEYCLDKKSEVVSTTVLDAQSPQCAGQYCLQWRMETATGSPVKNMDIGVFVGDAKLPMLVKTNDDGFIPIILTKVKEKVVTYDAWETVIVPPGANDYERSRDK
jgi:hypothetical protein